MNNLTDIIKRYGIIGCLYKTIFKVVRMLGITYIKYLAYFKELPETIDRHISTVSQNDNGWLQKANKIRWEVV